MSNQKGSLKCQTFDIEVYKKTDKEVDRWNEINSISPNIIDTSLGKGGGGDGGMVRVWLTIKEFVNKGKQI